MYLIYFGDYTLKNSSINYYKVEEIKSDVDSYIITLYLTNGDKIVAEAIGEGELESITEELNNAMREVK